MDFKILFRLCVLLVVLFQQISASKSPSYDQNIDQQIKGKVKGKVNQKINQDIENDCSKNEASVNQNIKQDITARGGNTESINQNIEQKIHSGCSCIEHKTTRAIKNHEKRSNKPCNFEDIIFKRHHKNWGSPFESSEEIKIRNGEHSSEIFLKNHEDNFKDLSEDSSEEIVIKYNKKPCAYHTSEEIVFSDAAKAPKKNKPCNKKPKFDSSEEISSFRNIFRPCPISRPYDVSSEEKKPKKYGFSSGETSCKKYNSASSEEETRVKPSFKGPFSFEESSEESLEYLRPKTCKNNRSNSSPEITFSRPYNFKESSEESSEWFKPKPCGYRKSSEEIINKPCAKQIKKPYSFESSEEDKPAYAYNVSSKSSEEIIPNPCFKPAKKPCGIQRSSEERQRPWESSEEIISTPCFKPTKKPCNIQRSSEERWKPWEQKSSKKNEETSMEYSEEFVFKPNKKPCSVVSSGSHENYKNSEEYSDDSSEEIYQYKPIVHYPKPVAPKPCPRCQESPCSCPKPKDFGIFY